MRSEYPRFTYIFLFIFILINVSFVHAIPPKKSITYTVQDGLNRNVVTCIIQDTYGYGWIGTSNGLARFDGYTLYKYKSLEDFYINSTVIANDKTLWVSANHGLYKYSYLTDSFTLIHRGYSHHLISYKNEIYYLLGKRLYKIVDDKPVSVIKLNISSFLVTEDGILYSSKEKGLRNINSSYHILGNRHIRLIKKIDDKLFMACFNGDLYVRDNNDIKKITIDNHNIITDIKEIDNEFWISTNGNGIVILDKNLNFKEHLYKKGLESSILSSNSINSIYYNNKIIWISSYGGGLTALLPDDRLFENIEPKVTESNKTIFNEGYGIYASNDKCILGTNYGLYEWNEEKGITETLSFSQLMKDLNGSKVRAISKDSKGNYLIGTYDGLIGKYSPDFKLKETFRLFNEEKYNTPLQEQKIVHIFHLKGDEFMISSLIRQNNFVLFNSTTGKTEVIDCEISKTNYQIKSIRKNKNGEIIVLINRLGLFKYNRENNNLTSLFPDPNKTLTLVLNDFFQDKNGNYHISTKADGLLKLDTNGHIIEKITTKNGLKSDNLFRIESTNDSCVWISSIRGLVKLDLATNKLQTFDNTNGITDKEFTPISSARILYDSSFAPHKIWD